MNLFNPNIYKNKKYLDTEVVVWWNSQGIVLSKIWPPPPKKKCEEITGNVMTQSGSGLKAQADRCHRSLIAQIDR